MRALLALLLILLTTPRWAGEAQRPVQVGPVALAARRVALDPARPGLGHVGGLRYLGGVELRADARSFGGYSALAAGGGRFLMLGDKGNLLSFRMGSDWRPRAARLGDLPGGPGTGWRNQNRDAESLTFDPRTGRWWVGFEVFDQIWRYAPGFARAERGRAPIAMRRWPSTGGAEAMARLADGRFVVLGERARLPRGRDGKRPAGRVGLIFAGDPTDPRVRPARFAYRPAAGFDPVDMAELPDGRVLVLERRFALPFRWSSRLAVVARGAIRPGAVVAGRTVAVLAAPLVADNFEGLAVAREGGRTVLWLVSDDNQLPVQRTLLLKFGFD